MRSAAFIAISLSLTLARPADDLKTIELNGMPCGPEGTATSVAGKALNRIKNRYQLPDEDAIDPDVSLPAMLAPGNDVGRFSEEKAAAIRGYVVRVMVGGNKETCNCGATKPDERDTHIELALAKDAPPTQRVIVEVTPRLRKLKGAEWTTKALKKKIEGQWVEVTGWLLFDTMHIEQAENTKPGNPSNWRATCWELHPATAIEVLAAAPAAAPAFEPKSFAALQGLHAAHVARHPKGKAAVEKRNKSYLSKFDKEELKEAEEEAKERRPK
jgi:hypothetical protein